MELDRQSPLQVGDKFLGKYEVRGLLGRGGYGYVYDCVDSFLGRSVALKICKPARGGPSDIERQAQKEARALLLVSDERLVKLIDAGTHDGLVYLVMEKLHGRTLRDALHEVGRLTVPEALCVMLQVARALSAAHRAGVIHRDIKPENIFIEADLSVKVLDLGIAKVQGLGAQTTHKDGLRGTVLYMAPEQLQGHGVTPRTDVYALGVVGFEMMFRHHLYLGNAPPAYEEAAWQQISFLPPMLDELDPAIPHDVAKLVRRMLLKSPEQRCESMDQAIDWLLAALKRAQEEWEPQGRFILRPLHAPLPPQAAVVQTARPMAGVPSGFLTVTEAPLPAGHPFARPATDPGAGPLAFVVSTPASGRAGLPGRSTGGASPRASRPPQAERQGAPPSAGNNPGASPYTPPPVAAPTPPPAGATTPPLLKDPAVRLAGAAAVVLGLVAGTSYGWIHFGPDRSATAGAPLSSAQSVTVVPAPALSQRPPVPAPATEPGPAAAAPDDALPGLPVLAPPSAAEPTVGTTTAQSVPPAPRRAEPKAAPASKPRDSLSPSDEEIKRRMEVFRSDPKPQPSAAPSARLRMPSRSGGTSIF